jgi:alpha-galactosidase
MCTCRRIVTPPTAKHRSCHVALLRGAFLLATLLPGLHNAQGAEIMKPPSGAVLPEEMDLAKRWVEATLNADGGGGAEIVCLEQGWEDLKYGFSCGSTPLCLAGKTYVHGLGTHANSRIRVNLPGPAKSISALAGIDDNPNTKDYRTEVVCSIEVGGKPIYTSDPLTVATAPARMQVNLNGATELMLLATGVVTNKRAHFDWVDPIVTLQDGTKLNLGKPHRITREPRFSFRYGGQESSKLLKTWKLTRDSKQASDGITPHQLQWLDPATGLQVTCELNSYTDFPAAEWVVRFKNTGDKDTPILEAIQALDTTWETYVDPVLHRSKGGHEFLKGSDDFLVVADRMGPDTTVRMASFGGKSSAGWMPYFNLQCAQDGLIGAIGWTGQWAFSCERQNQPNQKTLHLTAGMEKTHLILHPGEEIRTPSSLLVFWQGNETHATNLFRRLALRHYAPQADGRPVQAPLCMASWGGVKTERHLANIEKAQANDLKYDCYWIDAGWYGEGKNSGPNVELDGVWYNRGGDWRVNKATHPNGFKPIADKVHSLDWKFLLWVEPERAVQGTPVTLEHPEWFQSEHGKREGSLLLNLGIPEARQYITDTVVNLFKENGVDYYRQDFNFYPLNYWHKTDTPDRQGISEIRYIEGLYAYLDDLRTRLPGLLIDNCASGGCRLDIEMCKRSIPLWRSDAQCPGFVLNIDQGQTQTYFLARWLPLNGTGCGGRSDAYHIRSQYSSAFQFTPADQADCGPSDSYPFDFHRKIMNEYRRIRPYYTGDFYPLAGLQHAAETHTLSSREALIAYQFDREDLNEGLLMAFRHQHCSVAALELRLQSLDPEAQYEVEDLDSSKTVRVSGKDLLNKGLRVDFAQPRESRVFVYRKAK